MRRFLFIPLMIVLVSLLIFSGCAAPKAPPGPEQFTLRYYTQWPEQSPTFKVQHKPMLEEIEQKSNGRIKFDVFLGGALGPPQEAYDMVMTGKVDIANVSPGYTPGRAPLTDVLTLPGAYAGEEATQDSVDMVLAVGDRILYKDHTDIEVLSYFQSEVFFLYTTKKPVRSLEDLTGLKIRQPGGGPLAGAISALGAVPVSMPMGDLYIALQTGVIDGAAFGPSAMPAFKLYEVVKHCVRYPSGYAAQIWAANPDTWKEIPDDLKILIKETFRKTGTTELELFAKDDPEMTKELLARGGTSYTLPAEEEARWTEAIKPVIADWVASLEAKGLPGEELMDIVRQECQKRNIPFQY